MNQETPSESPARKRGTRLPDDFEPTPEMIEWARKECPNVGRRDHEEFMDYWRSVAGQRGLKLDWTATWRNSMRRANDQKPSSKTRGGPRSTTSERIDQVDAAAAELDRRGALALGFAPTLEIGS